MKKSIFITFLSFIFCWFAHAEIPVKKPLSNYSKLWTPSLFTTPPVVAGPTPTKSPFDDYHLTSIAPVEGGYWITIAHKKDKKKIVIQPNSSSKYQVVSVDRNSGTRLGTIVTLSDGQFTGQVRFEPNLVVLNTPNSNKPPEQQLPPGFNPNQPNQPNQQAPGQITPPPPSPRPRIVPPAKSNQNPANNNSQQRPQRTR
jgi:hypothetical protein